MHSSVNNKAEQMVSAGTTAANHCNPAPVMKRSHSCPNENQTNSCEEQNKTRPATVKRTNSSAGITSPLLSPVSSPIVQVKQEKPDSLDDLRACQEKQKLVSEF